MAKAGLKRYGANVPDPFGFLLLQRGRAGGAWDGAGISSAAAAAAGTAQGYADSGAVDFDDLLALSQRYGAGPAGL